jgi:hypothetical protein
MTREARSALAFATALSVISVDALAADSNGSRGFIVTMRGTSAASFVEVPSRQTSPGNEMWSTVYFVDIAPREADPNVRFESYLVTYDCKAGTFYIKSGMLFRYYFSLDSVVTFPANERPVVAAQRASLATAYGYAEACGDATHSEIETGKSWQQMATELLLTRSPAPGTPGTSPPSRP